MNILKEFRFLLVQTTREFLDDKAFRLGAALAYYSVFSLAPLLLIATSVAGMIFGDEAVKGELRGLLTGALGEQGAAGVQRLVEDAARPGRSALMSAIGFGLLLVGASGVFGQLQDALNAVWGVESKRGKAIVRMVRERFLAFGMVLGMGGVLLASTMLTTFIQATKASLASYAELPMPLWTLAGDAASLVMLVAVFAVIFKVLPDVVIPWRSVWIGAIFTAVLFSVGKFGLAWYLGREATTSAYGPAGSLILVLLWVHYSSLILLFGAEFTQVSAARRGVEIVPSRGAKKIEEAPTS